MSDIMFNDIPYNLKEYMVHDDQNIKGFFGPYRWLSNFHLCSVEYEGVVYPSSENAYQAAKIVPEQRGAFVSYTPSQTKRLWKSFTPLDRIDAEWSARKYDVMYSILLDKYTRNPDLKAMLLATDTKYLEETNHWSDVYWGVYFKTGEGENNLGKILMDIRRKLS
jgi:ribA/ribD-fused uncharacterized protein